ncbi:MAG: hypothetical protein SGPRY_012354, partial [Prymnesium sp.]
TGANALLSAEFAGGHEGLLKAIHVIDTSFLPLNSFVQGVSWDALSWTNESESAAGVLNRLMEAAIIYDKSEDAVRSKWAAIVHTAFDSGKGDKETLRHIIDNFVNHLPEYPENSGLLVALLRNTRGSAPLGAPVPPPAPPAFPRRRADVAGAEAPFMITQAQFEALMTSRGGAGGGAAAPAPPVSPSPPGADAAPLAVATPPGRVPLVPGFSRLGEILATGKIWPKDFQAPLCDTASVDGKFGTNCPFCGVGAAGVAVAPTQVYSSFHAYYKETYGCSPYCKPADGRPLQSSERIAHFSPRCDHHWRRIHEHVRSHPEDRWMLEPVPTAKFIGSLPESFNSPPQSAARLR